MPAPHPIHCGGDGEPSCPPTTALMGRWEAARAHLNWYWNLSQEHKEIVERWATTHDEDAE